MPIEPAVPSPFKITKFHIEIIAYNSSGSEERFSIDILPSEFISGNTSSLYTFRIRISGDYVDECVFYNNDRANGYQYYYNLATLPAVYSTLQLQKTKNISRILLYTYFTQGTTEYREVAISDSYNNPVPTATLLCKLYNKKFNPN